jgi:5-methyltetrahydropteroyltriglutamate--homocysteine methyltransferase
MIQSAERILTTHTGSLPRPEDLTDLIWKRERGQLENRAAFDKRVAEAVADVVRQQVESGVDIVSDGEQGPGRIRHVYQGPASRIRRRGTRACASPP